MDEAISEFAAAKINLTLHVLGRRPDGYHELDSLVAFANVGDELLLTPAGEFSIIAAGPFAGDLPAPEDNLIFAAWKAVGTLAGSRGLHLPPVRVALTKNLPVAAGIGGGSANAAAAIRGFMRLAGIAGIDAEINHLALTLGADVPACLISKACRLQGVGERITPLKNFTPLHAVLVNPRIEIRTADVFRKLGLAKGECHVSPSPLRGGVGVGVAPANTTRPPPPTPPRKGEGNPNSPNTFTSWRNDLTPAAIALVPMIGEVIETLNHHLLPSAQERTGEDQLRSGRPAACMSGSGATCFGIFDNADEAREAARTLIASHPHYWTRQVILS